MVRYNPTDRGTHRLRIKAATRGGELTVEEGGKGVIVSVEGLEVMDFAFVSGVHFKWRIPSNLQQVGTIDSASVGDLQRWVGGGADSGGGGTRGRGLRRPQGPGPSLQSRTMARGASASKGARVAGAGGAPGDVSIFRQLTSH